jgi:hypothetical protein
MGPRCWKRRPNLGRASVRVSTRWNVSSCSGGASVVSERDATLELGRTSVRERAGVQLTHAGWVRRELSSVGGWCDRRDSRPSPPETLRRSSRRSQPWPAVRSSSFGLLGGAPSGPRNPVSLGRCLAQAQASVLATWPSAAAAWRGSLHHSRVLPWLPPELSASLPPPHVVWACSGLERRRQHVGGGELLLGRHTSSFAKKLKTVLTAPSRPPYRSASHRALVSLCRREDRNPGFSGVSFTPIGAHPHASDIVPHEAAHLPCNAAADLHPIAGENTPWRRDRRRQRRGGCGCDLGWDRKHAEGTESKSGLALLYFW